MLVANPAAADYIDSLIARAVALVLKLVFNLPQMADSTQLLPSSVTRNLANQVYERRKNAALEVEGIIKTLVAQGDHDKIAAVLNHLINDFASSTQAHNRKGGMLGLAGVVVGLAGEAGLCLEASQHIERIIPPVLHALADQDSRVRYYACEALYNIAKVARNEFIVHFNDVFDALCKLSADPDHYVVEASFVLDRLVKDIVTASDQFSVQEFIPLLRDRMNILNPKVRKFLVGWIITLDSVPDIDMLGFLPDFLDGLFNMLSDQDLDVRKQADSALVEFLQEMKTAPAVEFGKMTEILVERVSSQDTFTRLTALKWMYAFVKFGRQQLMNHYAIILGAILPCISDPDEKIRLEAYETNTALRDLLTFPQLDLDISNLVTTVKVLVSSESSTTRYEALRWLQLLLDGRREQLQPFIDSIFPCLLLALNDPSDQVVHLVLEVQASIAIDENTFRHLMYLIVHRFSSDRNLLKARGHMVVRRLCQLLDAERIYREFALILDIERDLEFATVMVQTLNAILLRAPELLGLRNLLKQSLSNERGRDLFISLYNSWCHAPVATISLCLLVQAYTHASVLVSHLGEEDVTINLLVQMDRLIFLLETPVFVYLRLQLLDPGRYSAIFKTLYGILMVMPQASKAYKVLRTRLKSVPTHALMQMSDLHSPNNYNNTSSSTQTASNTGSSGGGGSTAPSSSRGKGRVTEIVAHQHPGSDIRVVGGPVTVRGGGEDVPIDFQKLLVHFQNTQIDHRRVQAAPPVAEVENDRPERVMLTGPGDPVSA